MKIVLQHSDDKELQKNSNVLAFVVTNLSLRFFENVNFEGETDVLDHPMMGNYLKTVLREKEYDGGPTHTIVIGNENIEDENPFYIATSGWSYYYSKQRACDWSHFAYNPLVAAFGAAFIFGEIFKDLMKDEVKSIDIRDEHIYSFVDTETLPSVTPKIPSELEIDLALVGCGGVGQSVAYLLQFFELHGELHFIDHDKIDKSNLQRYLLTTPNMINKLKVQIMTEYFSSQQFLYRRYNTHSWSVAITLTPSLYSKEEILVSIDNKRGRNEVQAALPKLIWNTWTGTSPGELRYGFGNHELGNGYQCLACVYFPKELNAANQMEFNAKIIGLTEDELREKIDNNEIFTEKDLAQVMKMHTMDSKHKDRIQQLVGNSYKDIFHGNCGLLQGKLGEGHEPTPAPHIPTMTASVFMIHYILDKIGHKPKRTNYTVGEYSGFHYPTNHNLFNSESETSCICNDPTYKAVYDKKWNP